MMKLVQKLLKLEFILDEWIKMIMVNKIESNIGDVLIKLFCDNKKI